MLDSILKFISEHRDSLCWFSLVLNVGCCLGMTLQIAKAFDWYLIPFICLLGGLALTAPVCCAAMARLETLKAEEENE